MITNKFDHSLLFNNFNILRKSKHLSKGEFNKLIGVVNAYRSNYFSIGSKLLKGIQDNFPGITEEWLLTPHDTNYVLPEYNGTSTVAESQAPYASPAPIPAESPSLDVTEYYTHVSTAHLQGAQQVIQDGYDEIRSNIKKLKAKEKRLKKVNTNK